MAVEWQRNAEDQLGAADSHYPQFEAWQTDNPVDNCWCLSIKRSADQKPIKVRDLQSPETVEKFVRGFLQGLDNYNDDNLPAFIHFVIRETQIPCADRMAPSPSGSLRVCAFTGVGSAPRRVYFPPQTA